MVRGRHKIGSCDAMCKSVFAIAMNFFFDRDRRSYISRATSGSMIVKIVPSPFVDALA